MVISKYPIGTNIRFLGSGCDKGKTGKIVVVLHGKPVIFLPKGVKNVLISSGLVVTWLCGWDEIEPIGQVQLLFDFMKE